MKGKIPSPREMDILVSREIDFLLSADETQFDQNTLRNIKYSDIRLKFALRRVAKLPEMQRYSTGFKSLQDVLGAVHNIYPWRITEHGTWYATLKDEADDYHAVSYDGTYLEAYLAGAKHCVENPPLWMVDSVSKELPRQVRTYHSLIKKENATAIVDKDTHLSTLRELCKKYIVEDGEARFTRPL